MNHNRSLHAIALVFVFFCSVFEILALDGNQDTTLPKAKNRLYVVAHRGAHINIPENSLPAYRKAIDLGCDFVEIDVRTTKDGRFVSIHNSEIDEYVKGSDGKVSEMTFSEVKALDIGIRIGPEWKDTRVPSFEEILQLCRGKIGIYLDLKAAPVPELIRIIKQYKMERDILWYIPSNRLKEISELSANCPECIVMPDPMNEENVLNVIEKFNVNVLATDMGELSNSFVYKAHSLNAAVIVDEDKGTEAEWTKIIEWHTDGIQTDNPEKLISFLKRKKNLKN